MSLIGLEVVNVGNLNLISFTLTIPQNIIYIIQFPQGMNEKFENNSRHFYYFSHIFLDVNHVHRKTSSTSNLDDSNNINQNFSIQPYFDFTVPRNITTRVGQTAFLNCRVEQLGDKSVSILEPFFILSIFYGLERLLQ